MYSAPPIREVPFSCEAADIDVGRSTAEFDVNDTRRSSRFPYCRGCLYVLEDDGARSPRLLRLPFLPVIMLPFAACAAVPACVAEEGNSRVPTARASGVV